MRLKRVQRTLKESVGKDLSEYQKWVDYDMEKYGRVSKDTFSKIRAAGLNIVRDQYGEYEVIAKRPVERDENTQLKEDLDKEIKEHVAVDRYNQLTKENVKPVIILKSNAKGDILQDKDLNESDTSDKLDESLKEGYKDFAFIVKCNDGPKELIRVIAEDRFKAEEYAKKMYAQNHTTYADDRYNIWSIDEDLSSDIDKVKHAVDQFKGQVTVSKDSGNDVREYLLSKNISFMIDDSKSAKGKLTFMLKYPIPKLLNKNENLSGNMTKEAEEKLTTYYQIWAKGPSDSKFHFQDEYAYLSELVEEAKGYMQGYSQVRVLEVEEDESGNVVKRNGEVLFYSDGAVQTVDKELFDVATPQETADMFGKKVYSKKENKLYTPTGPVFETDNLTESKEDTQYGVHSFSQSSIIFRGTEEECAEFIADHNLWDDAEIYAMTPDDPHYLKESEENGLEDATQEYTSANTSINSAKLPAIFSMVNFKPETINLDYGGGKFDNATTALEGKGVTNLIYDPYNRSSGHNKDVIDTVRKNGGADTVTCSNVLNVIKEPEARKAVIKNIYSLLKNSGTAYFTVYEGTGKGNEGPTRSGYQLNKKTGDYVEEISSVFPSVSRRGKLIIASKETSLTEEFDDDDWSDTLETGGEPTYCPDCGVKFVRDEEGDAICPKCNKTPYQLANKRRKNESLTEDKEDSLQPHIDGLKSSVAKMEKKIKIAKEQAEKHPENRAFFNNMISDLQSHIDYNKKQIDKFENAEKVDLADVFNAKMMDRALTDRDEKNQETKSDRIKPDVLKKDTEAFEKLEKAAELLAKKSPNKYKYSVGDTYLDFGSDYQWTTIIAYKQDGSSYQALNPEQWEEIVNSKSDNELEKAVIDVLKDRFNPDRKHGIETAEDAMKALNELD